MLLPSDLHRPKRLSPLPPFIAPAVGGREASFLYVVRFRVCLLWCVVEVLEATSGQIKLSQLHYHTGDALHGGASELMAMCARRSLRSAALSSRCSSDLVRLVSRCVAGLRWRLGQGGLSRAKVVGSEVVDLPFDERR
jgi:hypothetical protein